MLHKFGAVLICSAVLAATPLAAADDKSEPTGGMDWGKTLGGALGGALGGFLGSKVGDGKGKTISTIVGVVAGAWLGSKLLEELNKADREAVDQTSVQALNNAPDGQTVTWRNPDTGVTAEVTPQATRQETRKLTIVRKKEIQAPPPFDVIGETYVAKESSNLRAGPSTDAAVVGSLKASETFTAIGKVKGRDWIIVGRDGKTVGYVFAKLVEKHQIVEAKSPGKEAPQSQTPIRQAISAEKVRTEISSDGAIDLDAEGLVVEEVAASSECRPTNLTLSNAKSGESETSSFKACKGADGAWEIM